MIVDSLLKCNISGSYFRPTRLGGHHWMVVTMTSRPVSLLYGQDEGLVLPWAVMVETKAACRQDVRDDSGPYFVCGCLLNYLNQYKREGGFCYDCLIPRPNDLLT